MRKLFIVFVALGMVLGFGSGAFAATIDFESTPIGVYSSLSYADLTIKNLSGDFDVTSASPGEPIVGKSIISWFQHTFLSPFVVEFNPSAGNVTSYSIGVGDYDADVDNTYLEVYDASWNLLGSDYYQNPAATYGGAYLSVTTQTAIKYAKFWDADPFPGAVYWDNLSYSSNAVPEPATMLLLGLGLMGLAGVRKKFKK